MSGGRVRAAMALVRVASRLVPRHRRDAWVRQWHGEVTHRGERGRGGLDLLRFAAGSIPHAVYLRRREATMRGWLSEVRHSVRALARRPGFSLLVVGTLAVGVAAPTAVFSLAEAMILRPLPLPQSDRLVRIFSSNPTATHGMERFSVSYPDFADFTARSDLFASASLYATASRDLSGEGPPQRIRVGQVHTRFFETLGSEVVAGRSFTLEDHDPAAPPTVLLAEPFWSGRFGSATDIVGRDVRLDGVPHTVVGVLAAETGWPAGVDLWTPLQWGAGVPEYADARSNHTWQVVARLQPDVRVEAASDAVAEMARAIYADAPDVVDRDRGTQALVVPLRASDSGEDATSLFSMLGAAVFLVLLIACMNASALLLTRAWARARELSLRSALGAGRVRLAMILLGESLALAAVGGTVGVVLGTFALRRAFAMAPPVITDLADVRLNGTVVIAGVVCSAVAALVAGIVPAVRAARMSLAEALKEGAGVGGAWGVTRMRRGIVVAELVAAMVLVVGASLAIRGFQRQIATDPGFDADALASFTLRLPAARYGDDELVRRFYDDAIERLERDPHIVAATGTSHLPMGAGGLTLGRAFVFEGEPGPPEGVAHDALWVEIDENFGATLGVRLREGRPFSSEDRAETTPVAIVNEEAARRMSPDESILGRTILSHYDERLPRVVVGVAPDLQVNGVARDRSFPVVYVPRSQSTRSSMAMLVRVDGDPRAALPTIREAVAELDPDVALEGLQTLRSAHALDLGGVRFLTTLLGTFGLVALLMAIGGVYGLTSYSVAQRTREIGVRMAMGATSGGVQRAVVRESALLAAAGLTIGTVLAYGGARVLASGMSGIAVVEISTFIGVAFLLAASVLIATWIPASRATRVDPVRALRTE